MKNTEIEKKINELSPELLDAISGGVMTDEAIEALRQTMEISKKQGLTKSDFIRIVEGFDSLNWEEYRNGKDFQTIMNIVETEWVE